MESSLKRRKNREKKKRGIRFKIKSNGDRLRVTVFRSLKHIYAQAIDDNAGITIASSSTKDKNLQEQLTGSTSNCSAATLIGKDLSEKLKQQGKTDIFFDRNGYLYHGRVKAVAESMRESGINF